MYSSRQFGDEQRQRRAANFSQTCNLLSQYIKEKGSLRDLNLEIDGKVENLETLVKLRSCDSNPVSASTINALKDKGKSAEQDPSIIRDFQYALQKSTSKGAAAATDPTAPLTIFYSGRVLVFDDCPANKAKELLALAKKGSSQISNGISSNTLPSTPISPCTTTVAPTGPPPPPPEAKSPIKAAVIPPNTRQKKIIASDPQSAASSSKPESLIPQQIEANTAGLRIARRSSIHKFLAKRKDRASATGPYNRAYEHQQPSPSSKGDEHLDLKL